MFFRCLPVQQAMYRIGNRVHITILMGIVEAISASH